MGLFYCKQSNSKSSNKNKKRKKNIFENDSSYRTWKSYNSKGQWLQRAARVAIIVLSRNGFEQRLVFLHKGKKLKPQYINAVSAF